MCRVWSRARSPVTALVGVTLAASVLCCRPHIVSHRENVGWTLTAPEAFDLHIDPSIFYARLPAHPALTSCHTQGLAIANDAIVISCSLYGSTDDRDRVAKSLLVVASLGQIEAKLAPAWQVVDITRPAKRQPGVLGHPSGLVYDGDGIWCATAVYAPASESRIARYDPITFQEMATPAPVEISDHIGTIAPIPWARAVLAFNWDSRAVYRIDMAEGMVSRFANPQRAAYQDCQARDQRLLCAGILGDRAVIDVLDDNLRMRSSMAWQPLPSGVTMRPFTTEGFALSEDGRFAYFLPDDLPKAELIRYRLDPMAAQK